MTETSFIEEFFSTCKSVGLPIFAWLTLGGALDQWLTQRMQNILSSPDGLSNWIWAYGLASILASLIFPTTALIWVIRKKFTFQGLYQLFIETLRAWGQALSWSFLFIIPGLVRWLRLSFVPFITLESKAYARGEVDALETSILLSKGRLGKLIGLIFIFSLLIPLLLTTWDDNRMIWQTPTASLTLTLVETLSTILFFLLLHRLFRSAAAKLSLT